MRTLALFLLMYSACFGQNRMVEYCQLHLGEKVGDGVCLTLIDSAVAYADSKWSFYNPGTPLDEDSVREGDIVFYYHVICRSGFTFRYVKSHIAIVKRMNEDFTLTTFEQNCEGKSLDKSKVMLNTPPSNLKFIYLRRGGINFYRAY